MTPKLEKPCSRCKKTKPLERFNKNKHTFDGRHGQCKACIALGRREHTIAKAVNALRDAVELNTLVAKELIVALQDRNCPPWAQRSDVSKLP